jgi:UDPglucose 6-dehydrogenase
MNIGFIGQGFIGKSYADDFENRGYRVIRYALEAPYADNKDMIKDCDIVFVAVPTPSTAEGFDSAILEGVISLVGEGKIVVIKSTASPGLTTKIQNLYPDKIVLFSPEFLREVTAAEDAANPVRNIIGLPVESDRHNAAAKQVMEILPRAPYEKITTAIAAEFLKYTSNTLPYVKIIFLNIMYDLVHAKGGDWDDLRELLAHDPYIAPVHLDPVHKTGRGAGGHCLIKDFAALREFYEETCADAAGVNFLKAAELKNIELLKKSNKDIELLQGVYGEEI